MGVQADQRAGGGQLRGSVAVSEGDRGDGERGERGRILRAERGGGVESVHEPGIATVGRIVQAVQQLHGRHRVAVRVVGVRGDGQAGEGQVGRRALDPDVEQPAVIGLPDVAQARGHRQDRARVGGHVAEQEQSFPQDGGLAGAAGQPVPVEHGPVAVGVKQHRHGAAGRDHLRHGDIRGNVGDVQQPLAADRVTAERARAVVAQPDRGHAGQGRPGGLAGHGRSAHDR